MAPSETEDNPAPSVVPTKEPPPTTEATPPTPRQDEPAKTAPDPRDIEEGRDEYRLGGFHPVYIGDVYADKYQILNKIGYGVYSTVWLVQDLTKPDDDEHRFLALKVLSGECYYNGKPVFEREILRHLRDGDRSQRGYRHVCHLVDDFEHQGPNGKHVCLVFELMGETMTSFGAWFKDSEIPYPVMRRFAFQLVVALGYAHERGVIHTDIKPSNIFVRFQDRSLIQKGYLARVPIPQQDRAEERYTPVRSIPLRYYYFGDADHPRVTELEVTLGDWGVSSWATQHLTERIQPVTLRSPEVLIEAPWDKSTDWWNLGAIIFELFCAMRMFDGGVPPDGHYEVKGHVAEIVDFFGPFPKELLDKGNQEIVRSMFDGEGKLKGFTPGIAPPLESEVYMTGLPSQEARDVFGDFLRTMMKINPADRPAPEVLLAHPWLGVRADGTS
ncbi:kinase-like domain-containing protein [Chaetomium tenue]|uniref:Kinase-like domain-containing protein n=1 Tax=Chaetomium tenue TaxID=1854479 RepID=A0ACB7NYR5_9PEZI|nr:kinase-like domain-containing protein [Chaetomium globosum]